MDNGQLALVYVKLFPKKRKKNVLYVSKYIAACSFACPCGCGTAVHIPTNPELRPTIKKYCWELKIIKRKATLHPSIQMLTPCRAHFWLKNGKIFWA